MSILNQTPPERLCDEQGRPYFSWDSDLTLEAWRALQADADTKVHGAYRGRLMRQARRTTSSRPCCRGQSCATSSTRSRSWTLERRSRQG